MKKIGKVSISFDCEGKWGMIDENQSWINSLSDKNLYEIYEFILSVLEMNNLKATFGFVGALLESEIEFRKKVENFELGPEHKLWIKKFFKKYENNAEGYFLPGIKDLFKDNKHELATHGYCHIPFNLLSEEEAIQELLLVKSQMLDAGIFYSSIIYPRNKIAHTEILRKYGIKRYRGLPNHLNSKFLPTKLNYLIESLNLYKKAESLNKDFVPGGVMIHWFHGYRKLIPLSVSYKKYDSMLKDAIKNNKVAHLWLHPHNLITSSQTKSMFVDLCEKISDMMNEGKLINVTFDELT